MFTPGYLKLFENGELTHRIEALQAQLTQCRLCPRQCGVNRLAGELGFCQAPAPLMITSAFPHFGEERELVGQHGSGTIFLTHCNLRCIFCQNDDISHGGSGARITIEQLAGIMLQLQTAGCHNLNLVTPTHYTPQIIAALPHAIQAGLRLPLVYNCSGYEAIETLQLLDGIIDIYMPDAKFADPQLSERYCQAADYFEKFQLALLEMQRQTGTLEIDAAGLAQRGVLIRHLVMPSGVADSKKIVDFIATNLPHATYLNIMAQYHPAYQAGRYPTINRRPYLAEINAVKLYARERGLFRGF
ncbi:radical SAM protein [candidate division KSB1 bacterium]|nr:radical SAM protein [candidate division KSB1 bacterium]